jgi:hypothetical protein
MGVCEMQKADVVLSILSSKSKEDRDYKFSRLYRNLFNSDFYSMAYKNIVEKGTQGYCNTMGNNFNKKKVFEIIEKIKSERYFPLSKDQIKDLNSSSKTCAENRANNLKCSDSVSDSVLEDILVSEIVKEILIAIYEPIFLDGARNFRPDKGLYNTLYKIKAKFGNTDWVIKININEINQDAFMDIVGGKIDDGRFIELVKRFIKAGYHNFKRENSPIQKIPQETRIDHIFLNIYLDSFDKYIYKLADDLSQNYYKGGVFKNSVMHVRYLNEILICISGNKKFASDIKENILDFLLYKLKIIINKENVGLFSLNDSRIEYLDYDIAKSKNNINITKEGSRNRNKQSNEMIDLLVPSNVINYHLKPFIKNKKAAHYDKRVNLSLLDIINIYNTEVKNLYNYYCLATDVGTKLRKFRYYHYGSLAKTIAKKEKSTVKKVITKYGVNLQRKNSPGLRKIIGVYYEGKEGKKQVTYYNHSFKTINNPKFIKDSP